MPPPPAVLQRLQIRTALGYSLLAPRNSSASLKCFVAEELSSTRSLGAPTQCEICGLGDWIFEEVAWSSSTDTAGEQACSQDQDQQTTGGTVPAVPSDGGPSTSGAHCYVWGESYRTPKVC